MNQEKTDKIDRYLSGDMTPEERQTFEAALQQDAELRQAVNLHEDIHQGINYHFQTDLKNRLKLEEKEASRQGQSHLGNRRWFTIVLGVAASFALVLGAGYWYIASQISPTELYYAHYQPYPNIINPVERSGTAPQDQMGRAMMAYEKGRYDVAITLFEQKGNDLETPYKFYLALSLLEVGESGRTVNLLEEVVASDDETFFLPALWYQGLAYLRAKRTEEAREVFNQLLDQKNSTYHPRAKEILERL